MMFSIVCILLYTLKPDKKQAPNFEHLLFIMQKYKKDTPVHF